MLITCEIFYGLIDMYSIKKTIKKSSTLASTFLFRKQAAFTVYTERQISIRSLYVHLQAVWLRIF